MRDTRFGSVIKKVLAGKIGFLSSHFVIKQMMQTRNAIQARDGEQDFFNVPIYYTIPKKISIVTVVILQARFMIYVIIQDNLSNSIYNTDILFQSKM